MTMRRRVLTSIMSVTTVVILLFAVPLGFLIERFLDERASVSLEHLTDVAIRNIDLTDPTDLPDASEFPVGRERFSLYSPAGSLVTGNGPPRLTFIPHPVVPKLASLQRSTVEEGSNLVTTLPVMSGETVLGIVRVERSLSEIDNTTRRALGLLIAAVCAVLGVGWFIALRLARTIATSTEALRLSAVRLGSGDFTTTAPTTGIRELDEVGNAITATAKQLGQLIDREHAFSADVSHQLRTPIAGLRAALETELAFPRDDRTTIVHESLVDVERFEQTITDILSFARAEQRTNENVVNVIEVVRNICNASLARFREADRDLTVSTASTASTPAHAAGNEHLLRQALDVLIDNAFRHGEGPTEVSVTSDEATVVVTITHVGSSEAAQNEPDSPGLGLALANRLIRAQGGHLVTDLHKVEPIVRIILARR